MGPEGLDATAPTNCSPIDFEPDANFDKPRRAALAPEGLEGVIRPLDGTVAAEHTAGEEEADLGQRRERARDDEPAKNILIGVVPELTERDLGAGDDDGLAKILEQEREGRGGKRHGVGPVKEEEAVKLGVIERDVRRKPDPV